MVPVWNTGGGVRYLIHIVAYCHGQYSETYNIQLRDAMETGYILFRLGVMDK